MNVVRFVTPNKKSTIRDHTCKIGEQKVFSGSRFKPIGIIEVYPDDMKKKVRELTQFDAENDGFDSLADLLLELGRRNKRV